MTKQGMILPERAALLIIDMINDLSFAGGEALLPRSLTVVEIVLGLRAAMAERGLPVIYVNDNFGQWHSERSRIVEYCARAEARGRSLVERMAPRADDYFVIKPQFSGFYSSNLPVLLPKLDVSRLILVGLQTDICVLFTAADAHMRDYDLWVPSDAVVAEDNRRGDWALDIMRCSMGADIRPTTTLVWTTGSGRLRDARDEQS